MGVSTDAKLSYGIHLEEGDQLPWYDEESGENDIEKWWLEINNFVNPSEYPYESGNYKPGFDATHGKEYYTNVRNFLKENPIPVEIVHHCSDDYTMYILATKTMVSHRGYAQNVDPNFFNDISKERQILLDFLEKYGIKTEQEPSWILSSYWG